MPDRPAAGLAEARSKPGPGQEVGNHSDVDPIHIGVVAYQLATGWPVIRLEGACGRPGGSWERVWLRLGNRGVAAQWLGSYEGALAPVLSDR